MNSDDPRDVAGASGTATLPSRNLNMTVLALYSLTIGIFAGSIIVMINWMADSHPVVVIRSLQAMVALLFVAAGSFFAQPVAAFAHDRLGRTLGG
jgi:hypothetical protein